MDLSEEEYEAFGRGVAALAAQRERKPRDFEAFVSFLGRNGPYGAVVDGANAALFGQNWEEGGFSFAQIQAVVAQLQSERPDLKPLVVTAFSCASAFAGTHQHCAMEVVWRCDVSVWHAAEASSKATLLWLMVTVPVF